LRTRLKLAALYTLLTIIIFVWAYGLNFLLAKILAEPKIDPLLHIGELLTVILVAVLSYYFAGNTLRPIKVAYDDQKRFLADVSHELQAPLYIMKNSAESVLSIRRSTKADYKKLIERSLDEIDYMSTTANNLLSLSLNDHYKASAYQKISLNQLIHSQVELMQPYASSRKVTIKEDCRDECFVYGDKASFKRAISNILQNAINFNKPGGNVSVLLHKTKKGIEITITDNGIGISKKDLGHIFERFYKAENTKNHRYGGGAGLGLALVQEIAKANGGSIYVQSRAGKGTVMTVIFPAA
jgi:signal transduction histidine kinase